MGNSNRKRREPSTSKSTRTRTRTREREVGEGGRSERLQELIREEVNFLLRNEVRNPRLDGVVVTMVELTGDGACARLWVTAETDDDPIEALEGAAGFFRSHLAENLDCKKTPELRFRRDPVSRAFARWPKEMLE